MKISFNQIASPNVKNTNGYGYAAQMCKESLSELGHTVGWRDPSADVEINFIQPEHWHWTGPYRIAYLPWESTGMPDGWVDSLNEVDEVWTPSPVVAQWFVDAGVKKEVRVYEHGVDDVWEIYDRPRGGRYRLLHHGAEALRKGGFETVNAFLSTLAQEPATLVMKMQLKNFFLDGSDHLEIHKDALKIEQLVALYHSCDAFVYPSWGEGFGLTPLQAMATGMPAIVTKGWAPYERLIPEHSLIKSELVESPWQDYHPGKMFKPDEDDLQDKLRFHYENSDMLLDDAMKLAEQVHYEYNWKSLTEQAFAHLV